MQGAIQNVQKAYTSVTTSDPVDPTLRCANQKPTKLNYTQMKGFKNVDTVSPKRNKKMKLIPHHLWHLPSVLKKPLHSLNILKAD